MVLSGIFRRTMGAIVSVRRGSMRPDTLMISELVCRTERRKPEWAEKLDDDVLLRGVLEEVYQALNAGMIVLASIGTRTLLDRVMFLGIGDPNVASPASSISCRRRVTSGKDERDILEIDHRRREARLLTADLPPARRRSVRLSRPQKTLCTASSC